MTAAYLVGEIFSRPQLGMPSNMRRITSAQYAALRIMMLRSGGVKNGPLIEWSTVGEWKYVLTEDRPTTRRPVNTFTLARQSAVAVERSGSLF